MATGLALWWGVCLALSKGLALGWGVSLATGLALGLVDFVRTSPHCSNTRYRSSSRSRRGRNKSPTSSQFGKLE